MIVYLLSYEWNAFFIELNFLLLYCTSYVFVVVQMQNLPV